MINENNKLIAEFMEYDYLWDFNYPENSEVGWYNEQGICLGIDLKFDTSWDWLMPIVKRIGALGEGHTLDYGYLSGLEYALVRADINVCYRLIVDFIKWLNKKNEYEK